jgi:hypothetical protein
MSGAPKTPASADGWTEKLKRHGDIATILDRAAESCRKAITRRGL